MNEDDLVRALMKNNKKEESAGEILQLRVFKTAEPKIDAEG